jgi:hypothetical protein
MSSATVSISGAKTTPSTEPEKKLKACCACPETKKARDSW